MKFISIFVLMPLRAFIDSDYYTHLNQFGERTVVLMPLRAFIDSDENIPAEAAGVLLESLNALAGIY